MKPKTFKRWCEDNGRRSRGGDYAEFSRNAADYESYLGISHKCIRDGCEANADGYDGKCGLHSPGCFEPIPATLHAVRFNGRRSGSIGIFYGIESGTVTDPRVDRSAALAELSHNFEHVAHAVWLVEDDRTDWAVAWGRDDETS